MCPSKPKRLAAASCPWATASKAINPTHAAAELKNRFDHQRKWPARKGRRILLETMGERLEFRFLSGLYSTFPVSRASPAQILPPPKWIGNHWLLRTLDQRHHQQTRSAPLVRLLVRRGSLQKPGPCGKTTGSRPPGSPKKRL